MAGAKEREYGLLAERVCFARVLELVVECGTERPGSGGCRDDQMTCLVWTRNAMICWRWEARWKRGVFKEGCKFPICPTSESARWRNQGGSPGYQLVSSIKKARPSFMARPYDIHKPIKVIPRPASADSMTYVRLLVHTFPSFCRRAVGC